MRFSLNIGRLSLYYGDLPHPTVYLVRHGQSLAKVDREVHAQLPDPLVPLSTLGQKQPWPAGVAIARHMQANGLPKRVRFFHSEYLRADETCKGVMAGFQHILPPRLVTVDHRADSRIHELEFSWLSGMSNVERATFMQNLGNAEHQSKLLRKHGAKFFDRRAGGESPADVEVRLRPFFGALYRDVEENGITHFVVVSHSLTNRVFAKAWLGKDFKWYEQQQNPRYCAVRYLPPDRTDGGYIHNGGMTGLSNMDESSAVEPWT
jgi:broad specificity phosphatase PhoE